MLENYGVLIFLGGIAVYVALIIIINKITIKFKGL